MKYIALLRGINVGGNNIIKMADLRASLEGAGFADVATYIQSGNIIFSAPKQSLQNLATKIEKVIEKDFNIQSRTLVLSASDMESIVKNAPKDFGAQPDKFRYDVIFLFSELLPDETIEKINPNPNVDAAIAGSNAVYFTRLFAKTTSSRLNKLPGMSIYKSTTIRNWNTTRKLLEMTG